VSLLRDYTCRCQKANSGVTPAEMLARSLCREGHVRALIERDSQRRARKAATADDDTVVVLLKCSRSPDPAVRQWAQARLDRFGEA
jgi:hypothetical protein